MSTQPSLQTPVFQPQHPSAQDAYADKYPQHRWWDHSHGWKNILNHLRLIIQPYVCSGMLAAWLCVFDMPAVREGLQHLVQTMNHFHGFVPT